MTWKGLAESSSWPCTGQPHDARRDGPGSGCAQDVSVSMMLQRFVATSNRNGLTIKSVHARDWPVAATSYFSEIEHRVKPVVFLTWKWWCLCANLCAVLAAVL